MDALETHQRFIQDIAYGARSVVVFVDYHRPQEGHYPVAFEEAYDATKYVTEHVAEFNVDPMRLAIAGDGVGGNTVGAIGLFAKERGGPQIYFQPLLYAAANRCRR
jgi:acetyl esterase